MNVAPKYHNAYNNSFGVIEWTRFTSRDANTSTTHQTTLAELAEHLVEAGPYREKLACPWIKLATFGDRRSAKNSIRFNENVVGVTGVEGDYDGGVIQPEQAVQMLERANIRAIVYTSPSHRPHSPRWRVIAPFSRKMPPSQRSQLLARVNGALGGVLAPESFVLSQSYFYGEVVGSEYKLWVTFADPEEGTCVDELDNLDEIAIGTAKAVEYEKTPTPSRIDIQMFADAVTDRGRLLKTGDGRRDLLKQYIASRSAKGLTSSEIQAMVSSVVDNYFDPADTPNPRDLLLIIEHFSRKDVKSQPVDLSSFNKKLSSINQMIEVTDPVTGEVKEERPLFTKVSDLLANIQPIKWLINGYLEQDALSMVFGPSGGGKSFVIVDMCCCIATGTPWHGSPVTQGSVFYIAGEGHNGLTRRFAAWEKQSGVKLGADVPLYKSNRAVMMLNPEAALAMSNEVERLVRTTGTIPGAVVIDTLARNFGDGDENTQKDAGRFIEHVDVYIRQRWGCNVIIVHHSGHDMDRARGSSAFKGAMDQEIWIKGAAGKIELKVTKMKDAEMPADKQFVITQIGLGVMDDCDVEIMGAYLKIDGDPQDFKVGTTTAGNDIRAKDVIKAMKDGWPGVPPMITSLGCSERTLSRIMTSMKDAGMAEKYNKGPMNKGWLINEKTLDEFSKGGGFIVN